MSTTPAKRPKFDAASILENLLPAGPVRIYGTVAIAASFFVSFWLASQGWSLIALVLPPVIALGMVTGKLRFAGPVFLALMLGALAMTRTYDFRAPVGTNIDPMTWFLSLATMVFLITQHRAMALNVAIFPDPKRLIPPWRSRTTSEEEEEAPGPTRRDPATFKPAEFWDVVIGSLGSLMLAQLILYLLPQTMDIEILSDFRSSGIRAIVLGWAAGVFLFAAYGFFAYRRWTHLSRREAGIYLRSVTWRWNAKEHESLERYRAKQARRLKT